MKDDLAVLRSRVCHLTADWLADAGKHLWVDSWMLRDQGNEAVTLVTQMVGQFGQEAADAFDRSATTPRPHSPGRSWRRTT